jgi:NhaP-type Na+/H+ or K+/H+ antiporter
LQALGFWNTAFFLANAILFVLVGLQLNDLAKRVFSEYSLTTLTAASIIITATVVVVRLAWFISNEYVPGLPQAQGRRRAGVARSSLVGRECAALYRSPLLWQFRSRR